MDEPRLNIPEWTVSELSSALKRTVEDAFGHVRVRGEISGFRGVHSSGHAYFALKDESARIDAVVWRTAFARMRVKPEEGLEVIATGRLTTYPGRSTYQIVIETLEPAGLGALMALLEQRKQALAAEGLFDEARKQLLPSLPNVIGVVTSPTGAVIRDILHRLADRFPRPVLVWPVRVQGEGAAEEIAAAIRGFNALPEGGPIPRPDLLIVARGGGSIEDLWAFNEEVVVRAAADSDIALISAVGHETDVTLIDFAADRRAPTPTAAAEMAVPVRSELLARVDGLGRRVLTCWTRTQEARRVALRSAARALPTADALFAVSRQRLDGAAGRLPRALLAGAHRHRSDFSRIAARLTPLVLRSRVARERERLAVLSGRTLRSLRVRSERRRDRFTAASGRLTAALRAALAAHRQALVRDRERIAALSSRAARASRGLLAERRARLARAGQLLAALSYTGVLARGFALVRGPDDRPLRSAAAVVAGQRLSLQFSDGRVGATADGGTGATPPTSPQASPQPSPQERPNPARPGRRKAPAAGQGTLF
ncbi:MAG: exodeoxyribonuclease VII large subunit [Rhodoplanes sp.]|uniref:exodeoxyribonuclease VII large subunit n=1 Tax=Rhodoplanes sp. TaxID=1968906 RepID=UPI001798CEA4|nr:exodeoxyribonuclease VII large subunit [Rhodoplanes sp.]NVO17130.1 exodeoxyribonuclease VII large subunit [Rhodoplanes sp.]